MAEIIEDQVVLKLVWGWRVVGVELVWSWCGCGVDSVCGPSGAISERGRPNFLK